MSDPRRVAARYLEASLSGKIGAVNTALQRAGLDGNVSFLSPLEAFSLIAPIFKRYGLRLDGIPPITGRKGSKDIRVLSEEGELSLNYSWNQISPGKFETIAVLM